jgi:hypothetical protein
MKEVVKGRKGDYKSGQGNFGGDGYVYYLDCGECTVMMNCIKLDTLNTCSLLYDSCV